MSQLTLDDAAWSTGYAELSYDVDWAVGTSLVSAVDCDVGSISRLRHEALLDTGAQWSVMSHDVAASLVDGEIYPTGSDPLRLKSRWGVHYGRLHEVDIVLPAIFGQDLLVPSRVLVIGPDSPPSSDPANIWRGPVVLGSKGFLERIRFAVDPGVEPPKARFYFGTRQG